MDLLQEGGVSEGCLWDCQAWGAWSSAGRRGLEAVASGHLARGSVQECSSPLIGSPSTRSWEKSPLITVAVNVYGATVLGGARHDLEPQGAEQARTV